MTRHDVKTAKYWPGSILRSCDGDEVEVNKKDRGQYSSCHLDRTCWGNKGFIIWPKEKTLSCGTNAGSHEQARLSHLARLGSQSEHMVRFILPSRTFGHIININIKGHS